MEKLRCASFFAGVGGIDLAFEQAGFGVVYANEIDKYAVQTYESNFDIKVDNRDIYDVKADELPEFDVMLAGFPCQAFSVAGYREGFNDRKGRGELFFELERIFSARKPKIVFLENVKNLATHDGGNTYKVIKERLELAGYKVTEAVLNAMHYGNIPQNRERIYIAAFQDEEMYNRFEFPDPVELNRGLDEFIDFNVKQEGKYYYTPDSCSFFDKLSDCMKNPDTVYQWRRVYVRENKSGVCPTLTANMGTGGHNVPLVLTPTGIRKLTPRECFNLQGFPKDYVLPNMANTRLYKQAGNSVVVSVVKLIAMQIKKGVENE